MFSGGRLSSSMRTGSGASLGSTYGMRVMRPSLARRSAVPASGLRRAALVEVADRGLAAEAEDAHRLDGLPRLDELVPRVGQADAGDLPAREAHALEGDRAVRAHGPRAQRLEAPEHARAVDVA